MKEKKEGASLTTKSTEIYTQSWWTWPLMPTFPLRRAVKAGYQRGQWDLLGQITEVVPDKD